MKTGLSMYSLVELYRGKSSVDQFLQQAKKWNLEGVELLDFFWQDKEKELAEAIALKDQLGLEVYCYSIGNNFVQLEAEARQGEVDKIAAAIEVAEKLGAKVIRVFSGDAREGITFDQAFSWIVEGLKAGAALAEKAGMKLALENHGLFAGKADQVAQVIAEVGSPALGATLDTGNFLLVDENPTEAVQKLADKAAMIHFKDFKAVDESVTERVYRSKSGKRYQGTIIGQGDVDLPTIVSILAQKGYEGYLSIEFEGPGDPVDSVAASIEYVNQLINKVKGA
ncbi:MAG: sugar phosphate isomerase/epimerase [Firmicutes bacterium]|nr:sugar phosphate isomerase/epimerase [Bacillota bacterium]HOB21377.1 sugar phosphate isomerase/epimerase family protein [Bacillota bacterium]HQD39914.1 sugar phosphate isomerase/epimerase family protein [Bacillota bacterium]